MKKLIIISTLILTFTIISGCDSYKIQNKWQDGKISIDGDYSDWEDNDLQFFEETNAVIGSVNDAENLYIMFRFTDQKLARRIKRMGVTLWLDKEGKKNKNYGIRYTGSLDLHVSNRSEINSSQKMS